MIQRELENFLRMLVFAAVQVFVCSKIHLMGYAVPLVYVAFVAYFPLNYPRVGILTWSFVCGLLMDIFMNVPGVASGSVTLVALLQPMLLRRMSPKDAAEDMKPSLHTLGYTVFMRYLFLIVAVHHSAFFALDTFSCFNLQYAAISCGSSIVLSFLTLWAVEHFRTRKRKAV